MTLFGLIHPSLGKFAKVRYLKDKAVIDNLVFRAHYRITSIILFTCCIIVSANNLIGAPIDCMSEDSGVLRVINTYCWITHTFTLPGTRRQSVGKEIAHPGLGNDNQQKIYHSYYQWVPFVLFFQGVLFYIPHWIWKQFEAGKLNAISKDLRGVVIETEIERNEKIRRLVKYIYDSYRTHNCYAAQYFFCELLNFVNVVVNIFAIDKFLGGTFMKYGIKVLEFTSMNQEERYDPMIEIFPRVSKCTFYKYGPSGSSMKIDALCILALNVINEKIYIFLWFWLILLAFLSGLAVMYFMLVILLPSFRATILKKKYNYVSCKMADTLIRKLQIGDFLLINFLGENMNEIVFSEFLKELCRGLYPSHLTNHVSTHNNVHDSVPSAPCALELSDGKFKTDIQSEDVNV